MSATAADNNNENNSNICANCGKGEEGSASLKACTACKLVKYCNRECQIAHRPQHKKACKKRAAELHDEQLFKQPPPEYEDCPICFLRLPSSDSGYKFMTCCGKLVCCGCIHAPVYDDKGNVVAKKSCPFCRTPKPATDEETLSRVKELMEAGNAMAIRGRGDLYARGWYGFTIDITKALELWHRAGELGNAISYHNIGCIYDTGEGVELDKKKAKHYYELAAIGGYVKARHNLGLMEKSEGNADRALKHFMIAAKCGGKKSLKSMKNMYMNGDATKDDYAKALRSYQVYLGEIKSDQRDKAAAYDDQYKYIE